MILDLILTKAIAPTRVKFLFIPSGTQCYCPANLEGVELQFIPNGLCNFVEYIYIYSMSMYIYNMYLYRNSQNQPPQVFCVPESLFFNTVAGLRLFLQNTSWQLLLNSRNNLLSITYLEQQKYSTSYNLLGIVETLKHSTRYNQLRISRFYLI